MLCLRCWHWWPVGSHYCGVCQSALNARRCADGHPNSLWGGQQTCCTCNQPLPYPGVPALPMGWLARGGTMLALFWLGYQAIRHVNLILAAVYRGAVWALLHALNAIPASFWCVFQKLLGWWIALYLVSGLLPKDVGGPVRRYLIGSVQIACRLVAGLGTMVGRASLALIKVCMRREERVRPEARHDRRDTHERSRESDGHH